MSKALGVAKERSGLKELIRYTFFERPLPKKLSWFTCLGGIALVTFLIQTGTGIFLLFFYVPSDYGAFNSVQYIKHAVPYGWLICKLHLVGAQIMIGCVIGHMIRVLFRGAYKKPRELYWVSGSCLLMLTLFMGYTGSRLPDGDVYTWVTRDVQYDSRADTLPVYIKSAAHVRYDSEVTTDGDGLSAGRFPLTFVMHAVGIPLMICAFMGFHFFMVRRHGISEPL